MTSLFKTTNSDVNWRLLIDFRNKLIHAYEMIDYELIWNSITDKLPSIKIQIQELLNWFKTQ